MKLKNLFDPSWERTRNIALWSWQAVFVAFSIVILLLILVGFSRDLFAVLLRYIEATTGR